MEINHINAILLLIVMPSAVLALLYWSFSRARKKHANDSQPWRSPYIIGCFFLIPYAVLSFKVYYDLLTAEPICRQFKYGSAPSYSVSSPRIPIFRMLELHELPICPADQEAYERYGEAKPQKSKLTLPGRSHQPLDALRKYFGHIGWGGKMSVRGFARQKFGEQILSNLHRIRFDAPGTSGFEIEPELQYFHPKGGGQYGIKSFYTSFYPHIVAQEVLPESKMHFTFGNKRELSEELKQNYIEILNANLVQNPEEVMKVASEYYVTAVVTYIKPDMCPEAEIHDVSLLPWPQKPSSAEAITFDQMERCYKHPEGWFYFIATQYNANHKDVQNYTKFLDSSKK